MQGAQSNIINERNRFAASLDYATHSVELVSGVCQSFSFSKHTHEEYTVGMVHSGEEVINCRGKSHYAGAGSLYFYNPNEAHDGCAINNGGWCFSSIYIHPDFILKNLEGLASEAGLPTFTTTVVKDAELSAKYVRLIRVLGESDCAVEKDSCLMEFLRFVLIEFANCPAHEELRKVKPDRIRVAKDFICKNFRDPLCLNDIAAVVGLRRSRLVHAFQETEGISPYAYLMAQRLSAALKLLKGGESPSAVAIDCGFYDQSHLNRFFGKTFGISPARFQSSYLGLCQKNLSLKDEPARM